MQSIKELYRIGRGPSSSHTMGPAVAAEHFLSCHPKASALQVTLYGSLASTGKDLAAEHRKTAPGGLAGLYRYRHRYRQDNNNNDDISQGIHNSENKN